MAVAIDKDVCAGCGACENACPVGAITVQDGNAVVDESSCVECGACVDECPAGALKV